MEQKLLSPSFVSTWHLKIGLHLPAFQNLFRKYTPAHCQQTRLVYEPGVVAAFIFDAMSISPTHSYKVNLWEKCFPCLYLSCQCDTWIWSTDRQLGSNLHVVFLVLAFFSVDNREWNRKYRATNLNKCTLSFLVHFTPFMLYNEVLIYFMKLLINLSYHPVAFNLAYLTEINTNLLGQNCL